MSLLKKRPFLTETDRVPPKAISAANLNYAAFNNKLTEDTTRLPNLYMNKELTLAVDSVSRKQGLSTTETSQLMLSVWH